jgi:2-phosphosulfolactate phosphatase
LEIVLSSLLNGAKEAQGTVVIIDVYRAFTTAAIAFSKGAEKIILVSEIDEALELKNNGIGSICMGEVGGMRPEGFDFGNSPFELSNADVVGKTIIQSTRAGTVGVNAALKAEKIYACSLVIAESTAKALIEDSPALVTIVAMGSEGKFKTDEDEQCALYLKNLLEGRTPNKKAVQSLVDVGSESQKYGDPLRPHFDIRDKEHALEIDTIPFAITVVKENGLLTARPKSVS